MTVPARTIDINADLGEGFPFDETLLGLVTSASIACGAHAGDRETIVRTLRVAKRLRVVAGAHPGFADREGFGRREQRASAAEVTDLILAQFENLKSLALEAGVVIRFVKPHGALYNQAQRDPEIAAGVVAAMEHLGLPVLGQPRSLLETQAREANVRFIAEGFPDRRYDRAGRLVPRSQPQAVVEDPAELAAQVVRLIDEGVATLCVHGDDPRSVENARTIRRVLADRGTVAESFV
jgi:UPF0271 protein